MRLSPEIREQIKEARKTMSIRKAAKHFGVATNTIRYWSEPGYKKFIIDRTYAWKEKNPERLREYQRSYYQKKHGRPNNT